MRRLLPLMALSLSCVSAQLAYTSPTWFAPPDWPALERILRQTPAFAGFSVVERGQERVTVLALTDARQEGAVRRALNADPEWRARLQTWQVQTGSVTMKTPLPRLLEVARQVQAEHPHATLRLDTELGRVRLVAPAPLIRQLAARLGAGDLLVAPDWLPPLTVQYDVQPRVVRLSQLPINASFKAVPDLRVLVKNTGEHPIVFPYGCGGSAPVGVVTASGQETPTRRIACTMELRTRLIQPGETVTFPSFPWNKLNTLQPGQYAWVYGKEQFPFTLTK